MSSTPPCFICCASSVVTNDVRCTSGCSSSSSVNSKYCDLEKEEERSAYHKQEKIELKRSVFVIKVLFQVPQLIFLDKGNAPIVRSNGLIERLEFCQSCSDSVQKANAVYREMLEALQNFRRIQLELVSKVKMWRSPRSREARNWKELEGMGNGVLDKWRKFVTSYEYGTDTDSFLLEDVSKIVESLAMSLQSARNSNPDTSPVNEVKSEYEDDSHGDIESDEFHEVVDHDDDMISVPSCDESGKDEEVKPDPSSLQVQLEDETDEKLVSSSDVNAAEEEAAISTGVINENEYSDWIPLDPLATSSNVDETPSNTDSSEEYSPIKKRRKIQKPKPTRAPPSSKRKMAKKVPATTSNHGEHLPCTVEGCQRSFATKNGLRIHLRVYHKSKIKTCKICNVQFQSNQLLCDHKYQDHPGSTANCHLCPRYFLHETGLKFHLKSSHSQSTKTTEEPESSEPPINRSSFKCPEEGCGKCFKTIESFNVHLSKHKCDPQFQCRTCDQKFYSWQQRQRHEQKVHLSVGGVMAFVCETCGTQFSCSHNLQVHLKKHHSGGKDDPPVVCETCGKTFKGKMALHMHSVTFHERRYAKCCEHCGKKFSTPASLNYHLFVEHQIGTEENGLKRPRKRYPEKEWKCRCKVVGCRRKFWGDEAEEKLRRHMEEKHGGEGGKEMQFKCEECGSQFNYQYKLTQHKLRHENKETRPFKCETCGKGFANMANLRYHQLNTHKAPRLLNRKKETKPRDFVKENEGGNK